MAYFPNGTGFAHWQDKTCFDCVNYRDNGTGSFGCAITDAHFMLDYNEGSKAVLNVLITEDAEHKCYMRLTREQMETEERARDGQADLEKYLAAMAEMSRDRDGARQRGDAKAAPVPQDRQARCEAIAQKDQQHD